MNRSLKILLVALGVAVLLGGVAGCKRVRLDNPSPIEGSAGTGIHEFPSEVTTLNLQVEQGVGQLRIEPFPQDLSRKVETIFSYAPRDFVPKLTVSEVTSTSTSVDMRVVQQDSSFGPDVKNDWTFRLPRGMSSNLDLQLGAVDSEIDLRGVEVGRLHVVAGLGGSTIDLSGPRASGVEAQIESGVGDLTIRLPRGIGVRIRNAGDGVGDISAEGFALKDGAWTNAAYAGTGPKIEVNITRGAGDITLKMVD